MIGALLVATGATGAGWALRATTSRRRPLDVLAALLAPLFVVTALVGAVALLSPSFFS